MSSAALRLPARVLRVQFFTGFLLLAVLSLLGPSLLLLEGDVARAPIEFALVGAPLGALGLLLVYRKLRKSRFALRAIALDSAAIEPDDVARLSATPAYVTAVSIALAAGAVMLFMATPLRPPPLDFDTALSLALLGLIIVATGALPLYVAVRAAVARVLELVPPDATVRLLEHAETTGRARRRLVWRVLLATATPVGFVAVASALIAHAHVRKFDGEARERTAEVIARVAVEPQAGSVAEAGRSEAILAARELGFSISPEQRQLPFAVEHAVEDGRVTMTMPLEEGAASVRFAGTAVQPMTWTDAWISLVAVGLAAAFGLGLGRSLSNNLAEATARVRALGTERVLRGEPRAEPPMRYTQVAALNRAIETLAGRFRIFARAQERALEARDAAQKLRSLLFASVSHDLKSPLNSILGFASLVGEKPLSPAQRESLGFIEQSGRELLVLIETILDTAKVEAGKMSISRTKVSVTTVVSEAVRRVRTLAAARPLAFKVIIPVELPSLLGDESRLVQALTTLIWYPARSGEPVLLAGGTARPVDVVVKPVPGRRWISITVETPSAALAPEELMQLLSPESWAAGRRRYGGLSLGLALAHALVELHRGKLRVKRTSRGTPLFEVLLPTAFNPFKSSPSIAGPAGSPSANGKPQIG